MLTKYFFMFFIHYIIVDIDYVGKGLFVMKILEEKYILKPKPYLSKTVEKR